MEGGGEGGEEAGGALLDEPERLLDLLRLARELLLHRAHRRGLLLIRRTARLLLPRGGRGEIAARARGEASESRTSVREGRVDEEAVAEEKEEKRRRWEWWGYGGGMVHLSRGLLLQARRQGRLHPVPLGKG